jgi:hypothetical protein
MDAIEDRIGDQSINSAKNKGVNNFHYYPQEKNLSTLDSAKSNMGSSNYKFDHYFGNS